MERLIFKASGWKPRRHIGRYVGKGVLSGEIAFCVDKRLVLRYQPWTGWLLAAIERHHNGVEVLRTYPWFEVKEMKKRSTEVVALTGPGMSLASAHSVLLMRFPNLMKQMSVVKYEDDTPRKPGSLFVSTQGSMWRVTVTEPDVYLKLTMMAAELDDALAGIELALGSESIPWELDQYAASRAPKKKK